MAVVLKTVPKVNPVASLWRRRAAEFYAFKISRLDNTRSMNARALELIASPDDQYWTIRVANYPVSNATKYQAPNTGTAMRAHGY